MPKLLIVAALLFAFAVAEATAVEVKLSDPVPGHPDVTVLELMRQVVTDLEIDADGYAKGTAMTPLRPVAADEGGERPAVIEIYDPQIVPLRVAGRPLTLLYSVLGHSSDSVAEVVLLALYDEQLRLIDAVDVGLYENNWLGDVLPIGAGDDLIRLNSEHFNSSQGYDATQLVFVRDNRFALIDEIYYFSVKGGSYEELQSLAITSVPGGPGYWPVTAAIHATRSVEALQQEEAEASEPLEPPYDRTFTQVYGWSASIGGYVADSDAFARLNAENEAKY